MVIYIICKSKKSLKDFIKYRYNKERMSGIIKTSNFNICDVMISKICKNKQGNNTAYITTKTNSKILLQSPQMIAPFGLSEYMSDTSTKYSLNLSFSEIEKDEKIKRFYGLCNDIDAMMLEVAFANSIKWFGKQLSKEIIEEFYQPLIKIGKPKDENERYPDTIKFKIRNFNNGGLNVEMYDTKRNIIDCKNEEFNISDIPKGSKFRCIFEISPVWFVNKTFGISLNCLQLEVDKKDTMSGYSFYDDSDDEK